MLKELIKYDINEWKTRKSQKRSIHRKIEIWQLKNLVNLKKLLDGLNGRLEMAE